MQLNRKLLHFKVNYCFRERTLSEEGIKSRIERFKGMNKTRLKSLAADILTILLVLGVALIISVFVRPTIVNGASMESTLHDGDYLIAARQAYLNHSPERGDIVIIQSTLEYERSDKGKLIIKRIIGLPGDKIEIIDSHLFVNNQQLQEEYISGNITPVGKIPPEGE